MAGHREFHLLVSVLLGCWAVLGENPVRARNLYDVLGVSRDASTSQIKKAYRKIALTLHPDKQKVGHRKSPEEKVRIERDFTEAQEAYEILNDPHKRRQYDEWGADGEPQNFYRSHGHPFDAFFGRGFGHGRRQVQPVVFSDSSISLNDHNFNHYTEGGGIWLIEFYSDSCGPCHEFSSTWNKLSSNLDGMFKMGRVDADGGFHGEYRTISVVQQFRRMLNGLPSVVAYDGNHYRSFRGHNDYDSLLRFATERIPLHIENLHRNQGTRFLQSGTSGKPRILLLSAHGTAPMLFRHAAFEFHQWIQFGFLQFDRQGALEREHGIENAPALLIQKEAQLPAVVLHDVPKDRKKLMRLLQRHRFSWVEQLTSGNYDEVCAGRMGPGAGQQGTWCLALVVAGPATQNHAGMKALQAVAQEEDNSDLLPAPTTFAWLDASAQVSFLNGVLKGSTSAQHCKEWEAPVCFVAINPKRREVAVWPDDQKVARESIIKWIQALSRDLQDDQYSVRSRKGRHLWPQLAVTTESSSIFDEFASSSGLYAVIIVLALIMIWGPNVEPTSQDARQRRTR